MKNARSEAGFTLIDVLFTMAIIGTLSTIAMPGLLRARSQASTAGAVGTLRVINSGQLSYAITCGAGFYAPTLPTLGAPAAGTTHAFIPADLGAAISIRKNNYLIQLGGTAIPGSPGSCNGLGPGQGVVGYHTGADSLDPTFPVHFSSNTSGAIWTGPVSLFATTGDAAGPPAGALVK
ncbi:MAG: type II secretion system GspH family protein [Acidobacteriota bacterium]|nr:type II secretion system GspH family protein [Acidobacteriota bacterium]